VLYALVFAGGLAGSLHCVGMCGGFPLALAGGGAGSNLRRQLLYHAGRLNTLALLGGVSGAAGAALVATGPARLLGHALALLAGGLMLAIGLEMLGVPLGMTARGAALTQSMLRNALAGAIASRSAVAPLALGVFNAFLPCQLIYAFAARAAATASAGQGILTMLAFGLGTVPAMLAVGTVRGALPPAVRARLSLFSGALVLVFAVITLARGFDLLPHVGHVH
jgi:uncharacterized protein